MVVSGQKTMLGSQSLSLGLLKGQRRVLADDRLRLLLLPSIILLIGRLVCTPTAAPYHRFTCFWIALCASFAPTPTFTRILTSVGIGDSRCVIFCHSVWYREGHQVISIKWRSRDSWSIFYSQAAFPPPLSHSAKLSYRHCVHSLYPSTLGQVGS